MLDSSFIRFAVDSICSVLNLTPEAVTVKVYGGPSSSRREGKAHYEPLDDGTRLVELHIAGIQRTAHRKDISARDRLIFALAHELRHVWQYQNWGYERCRAAHDVVYGERPTELDANEFAERFCGSPDGMAVIKELNTRIERLKEGC